MLPAPGVSPAGDLTGVLLEDPSLSLRLPAGVLIAFALGYLVRDRRAAKAVAAVNRLDGEQESPPPVPIPREMPPAGRRMALTEIRRALHSGHPVLLQMGYGIAPSHGRHFLALAQEARDILSGMDGQTCTVWEDPGRPNRCGELSLFRRLELLDQLASTEGPLPVLAEEIEACRVPSGSGLHGARLGALPDARGAPRLGPAPEGTQVGQRVD